MFDHILVRFCSSIILGVPAKLCLYTGNQFQRQEGLSHIIVCTQSKAGDPVNLCNLGSQHNYRIGIVPANPLADLKTIHIREHHIQDSQIQLFFVNAVHSFLCCIALEYGEPLIFQIQCDKIGNFPFIVHDKDFFSQSNPSFARFLYFTVTHFESLQ